MMTRSRFVEPRTVQLTLANGDTLIVKRRLNIGEQRESYRACSTVIETPDGGTKSVANPLLIGAAKVAAYLVDWYLSGDDESKSVRGLDFAQRMAVCDHLDPDDFYEFKEAIDAHEIAMITERLEEKKTSAGAMSGPAILPLPSAVVGASTGSENSTPTTTPSLSTS